MRSLGTKTLALLLCAAAIAACDRTEVAAPASATGSETPESRRIAAETARLNEWLDARYEEDLAFSPMAQTQLGRKTSYDKIDDMSESAVDQRLAWSQQTVADLRDNFDYTSLTADGKLSYDLWMYGAERYAAARPFLRRQYVFTQMAGPHAGLPQFLINSHLVADAADMQAYVARLRETARAITQSLERARLNAGEGVRPPRFAYDGVIEQARAVITGVPFPAPVVAPPPVVGRGSAASGRGNRPAPAAAPAAPAPAPAPTPAPALNPDGTPVPPVVEPDSPLWADAQAKIAALASDGRIEAAEADALRESARTALVEQVGPAYNALIAWLETDRAASAEPAAGVGSLPQGAEFYREELESYTTTTLTADEIHDIGLQEVARLTAEMEAAKQRLGFDGTLQELFVFLRTDPQFYFANDDEGREAYLQSARADLDLIGQKLPLYFGLRPKAPLIVKRVEAFREQPGAAQHYFPPALDGSRPGIFYAHLIDMNAMPRPQLPAIAYHEGIPGHHMQISIAQELTGIPKFRTQGLFTAYVEGWALYAELLAKEMGAYQDPYADFSRLTTEIWRAVRLVVDTGIHAKGWTEQQAVDYFASNSAAAEGQIRAEIRRYIVTPGQATSYKIGMLKILELRNRAIARLGAAFDIREFHDAVLGGGALPLPLLERRIDEWIAARTPN